MEGRNKRIKIKPMDNQVNLQEVIEDLKSLNELEIKEELISNDLAKQLAESFTIAYRSLMITNNITE